MFKRRYSVTIMNESWKTLKNDTKLHSIPRRDELVYLEEYQKYFNVTNVIHYLNNKHGIFVIVREYYQQNFFK